MMTEDNNSVIIDTGVKNETETTDNFIMDKDTVITHGSAITVRSQSSSSLADNYSDDAESSHDSIDTIATNEIEKDVIETGISQGRRRRALTVTQNPRVNLDSATEIQDHIQELQQSTSLIGDQDDSDSDSNIEEDEDLTKRKHKRHESHRSTMSSIHSFVSSASNYDLLLARLGSKDASSTTLNKSSMDDGPPQEIRTSFERVYNEAVCKGEEEDIDWGKAFFMLKQGNFVLTLTLFFL